MRFINYQKVLLSHIPQPVPHVPYSFSPLTVQAFRGA
jgi:hypothetical protein